MPANLVSPEINDHIQITRDRKTKAYQNQSGVVGIYRIIESEALFGAWINSSPTPIKHWGEYPTRRMPDALMIQKRCFTSLKFRTGTCGKKIFCWKQMPPCWRNPVAGTKNIGSKIPSSSEWPYHCSISNSIYRPRMFTGPKIFPCIIPLRPDQIRLTSWSALDEQ